MDELDRAGAKVLGAPISEPTPLDRLQPRVRRRVQRRRALVTVIVTCVLALPAIALAGVNRSNRGSIGVGPTGPGNNPPTTAPRTSSTTASSTSSGPEVRVFAGLPAFDASLSKTPVVPVTTVPVPGGRPVLGFVGYVGSTLWIASSSSASSLGGEVLPLDGSVTPLQTSGGPMSFAEGAGARWVYEREYQNPGQQYRLERYSESTPPTVQDNPVPADGQPAGGPLAVSDGAVWIPLRNGVARMDPRTGKLVAMLPLPFDDSRSLVVHGPRIVVSDNNAIRTIDPATNGVSPPQALAPKGELIYGLANVDGHIWVDLERDFTSQTLLRLDSSLHTDAELQLPVASGTGALQSANGRLWLVAALRIGVPENESATDQAVILIDPATASVAHTVVLHGYASNVAWTATNELLFSGLQRRPAGGSVDTTLYKITIDHNAPK